MQRLLLLAAFALLALPTLGCGAETGGEAGEDATTTTDVGAADVAGGVDGAAGGDVGTTDAGSMTTWTTPTFELGTNLEGKATPKDYVGWQDGQVAEVVKGPQGLWMVVVAFRTCGLYAPPLLLDASIATTDGSAKGKLKIGKQKLIPGGDGLDYYYNFWLVVENPENAGGKTADLKLSVVDAAGKTGEHEIRLNLVGGPQP